MKKNVFQISLLISLVLTFLVLIGCKKDTDENENVQNNSFVYQGQEYALSKGCISPYDSDPLVGFDLKLASSSIDFEFNDSLGYAEQSGTGNFVYIDLTTLNSDFTGTFVCDDTGNSNDIPHFEDGTIVMNGNFDSGWYDEINILDGGTLEINRIGDYYEIIFNWTSNEGKSISGYYKGELVFYNFD